MKKTIQTKEIKIYKDGRVLIEDIRDKDMFIVTSIKEIKGIYKLVQEMGSFSEVKK